MEESDRGPQDVSSPPFPSCRYQLNVFASLSELMLDLLTISFAPGVLASLIIQILKILSHLAPRAGDFIKLDASATAKSDAASAVGMTRASRWLHASPEGWTLGAGLLTSISRCGRYSRPSQMCYCIRRCPG